MTTAIQELCKGSGGKWSVGLKRHCPVCLKLSTTIAAETETTGNGGVVPRHAATRRSGR